MPSGMNIQPSKEEFLRLCGQGNVVPVYADLMADFETPVSAYAKLKASGPAYLLESIEGGDTVSRYSFIGCRPRKVFACFADHTEIREPGRPTQQIPTPHDPLRLIEAEISGFRPVPVADMPRFMGGAVGYLGYEYIHRIESTVPEAARDELGLPLVYFMLSDTLLMFDRAKQTLRLCVNAHVRGDPAAEYASAVAELHSLSDLLRQPGGLASAALVDPGRIEVPPSNFTRAAFERMVEDSKEYIRSGDIIQVVLAQRFVSEFSRTPLDLYRALRTVAGGPCARHRRPRGNPTDCGDPSTRRERC